MSREICAACNRVNPVGFNVPHEVWVAAVPGRFVSETLCIVCFAAFADERLVRWDVPQIEFFPVSFAAMLEYKIVVLQEPTP